MPSSAIGFLVTFYLEDPGAGTLESIGLVVNGPPPPFPPLPPPEVFIKDSAWALVMPDGAARVMLHSDKQGRSRIDALLWDTSFELPEGWEDMEVIELFLDPGFKCTQVEVWGFIDYFLAFEELELANLPDDVDNDEAWTSAGETVSDLAVDDDSLLRLRVKGFFEDPSWKSLRPEKPQDIDGDGNPDIILPAGRWVLPDDYPILADEALWQLTKPHWDIMDTPIDDIVSDLDSNLDKGETLGPYFDMSKHVADSDEDCFQDLVADWPVIGPLSNLEPTTCARWDVTRQPAVPADGNEIDEFDIFASCRTTVVPDGELTVEDANMPPAEILFVVTDGEGILAQVNKTDIYQRPQTCDTYTGVVYTNPYYWREIPANLIIPPTYGSGLAGYEWDSWDLDADNPEIDGPYRFWDGLDVWTSDELLVMDVFNLSNVPTVLKAYTDNHGEAWAEFEQKSFGSTTIQAIASYPYLLGDHLPVVSNPVAKIAGEMKDIVLYADDVDGIDPVREIFYVFVRNYDGTPATCEKVEWLIDGPWGVLESLLEDTDQACTNPCYPVDYWDCEDAFIAGDGRSAASCTREMTAAEITEFVAEAVFASATEAEDYAIAGVVVLSDHLETVDVCIKIHDCRDGEVEIITEHMMAFTEDNAAVEVGLAAISDELVMAYGYKPGEGVQGWTVYNPEWATTHPEWNTLTMLYIGRGYWLEVDAVCNLTYETQSYDLDEGWNLIGWLGA